MNKEIRKEDKPFTQDDLEFITQGNIHAQEFIVSFVGMCHMLDDIEDKDVEVTAERMIGELWRFLNVFSLNEWTSKHAALFSPLIITAFGAWLDSNDWENNQDEVEMRDADVLKGMYHEVVWYTAYLCGGWTHYRNVTTRFRCYDHDSLKAKEVV